MFSSQPTKVRFASFLSSGFTTMAVINPPEKKMAKRTSLQPIELPEIMAVKSRHFFSEPINMDNFVVSKKKVVMFLSISCCFSGNFAVQCCFF